MSERTSALLARIAVAGAVLTLAVIVASAYLRLVQLASGCESWQACAEMAADNAAIAWTRLAHRFAASAVAVLAIVSLVLACRSDRRGAQLRTAVALVAVTLMLTVVGVAGHSLAPAVAVANVLGGMAMLALFCRLALVVRPAPPVVQGQLRLVRGLGFTALGLLAVQIALGVVTSAGLARRTCPSLLSCVDALNVWHGVTAVMLATILFALASAIWRFCPGARPRAGLLIVLTTAEIALGVLLIGFEQPLAAAAGHSAIAALMVAVATWAAYQSRPADAAAVSALCQMRTSNQPPSAYMQR